MTVTNDPSYDTSDWDEVEDDWDNRTQNLEPIKSVVLKWVHELYDQANAAIRYLCGDIVSSQIEELYSIEISNEEGQEIFKAALIDSANTAPFSTDILQAVARALGIGEDL